MMVDIWRFPKSWGYSQIVHFRMGFSTKNHPAIGVPPFQETLHYLMLMGFIGISQTNVQLGALACIDCLPGDVSKPIWSTTGPPRPHDRMDVRNVSTEKPPN